MTRPLGELRRYAITEGQGPTRALKFMAANLTQGVQMIQIREKHLTPPELKNLVARALTLPNPHATKILVNTHVDIARMADGVHLPAGQPIPRDLPPNFLIGVSCHTTEEVQRAEHDGATFVLFGPVFATGGKSPVGLHALTEAARCVHIPVFALGGITLQNAPDCIAAGASGVAGIRLFSPDSRQRVIVKEEGKNR